jgi:hypothetical protein
MSVHSFQYENYCLTAGYGELDRYWNFEANEPKPGFEVIEIVDASKIPIRPRTDQRAVMLEDQESFEKFWFHIQ